MKKILIVLTLILILLLSCNSQHSELTSKSSSKFIVKNFIKAYNSKDSIASFKLLHEEFVEYYENNIAIASKSAYSNNYAWGKVMNDRMEFEITKIKGDTIEINSTYYSDRDSLLKISPYKSVRNFYIKDQQIIKIVENTGPDNKEYDSARREKYAAFFNWLHSTQNMMISDLKFDHNGAKKLKEVLIKYSKKE